MPLNGQINIYGIMLESLRKDLPVKFDDSGRAIIYKWMIKNRQHTPSGNLMVFKELVKDLGFTKEAGFSPGLIRLADQRIRTEVNSCKTNLSAIGAFFYYWDPDEDMQKEAFAEWADDMIQDKNKLPWNGVLFNPSIQKQKIRVREAYQLISQNLHMMPDQERKDLIDLILVHPPKGTKPATAFSAEENEALETESITPENFLINNQHLEHPFDKNEQAQELTELNEHLNSSPPLIDQHMYDDAPPYMSLIDLGMCLTIVFFMNVANNFSSIEEGHSDGQADRVLEAQQILTDQFSLLINDHNENDIQDSTTLVGHRVTRLKK